MLSSSVFPAPDSADAERCSASPMPVLLPFVQRGSLNRAGTIVRLRLSTKSRLYLNPAMPGLRHFGALAPTPTGIVVEPSSNRGLAADCPLYRWLGFNRTPSRKLFLLSPPYGLAGFRVFQQFDGLFFEHVTVNGHYFG